MSYTTLGLTSELQIKVPNKGFTGWADVIRTDTFLKIAQHDHTGSGNGAQLGTGSLLADAVTGAKIRLANDEYIRGRNQAGSADINMFKINTSDKIEPGADIAVLNIVNDVFLKARNQADDGYIDIVKVNTSDEVDVDNVDQIDLVTIQQRKSVTLTDNTAVAADASVITLAADETCSIHYRLQRGTDRQRGVITLDYSNAEITRKMSGDLMGVTFSIASNQLQYITTSTGNDVTMTYVIIKE